MSTDERWKDAKVGDSVVFPISHGTCFREGQPYEILGIRQVEGNTRFQMQCNCGGNTTDWWTAVNYEGDPGEYFRDATLAHKGGPW